MEVKFIDRAVSNIRRDGFRFTLVRKFSALLGQEDAIDRAKRKVLNALIERHGPTVMFGPFSGMKLSEKSWWGRFDLIAKILGVYEEHIVDELCRLSGGKSTVFIDIGAADGYFAIGMLVGGVVDNVYAFEIRDVARERLWYLAERNGCVDRISVEAEANRDTLGAVLNDVGAAVVLVDIEGAEYELLNTEVLTLLAHCDVIVELHPWSVPDGVRMEQDLTQRAEPIFEISYLDREKIKPNKFRELDEFTDDERMLAFSEGRKMYTRWMVMRSRAKIGISHRN